jgi:hypothetical protein
MRAPHPQRIVVSNSSPLIALGRIGRLDLLPSLFGTVMITQAVHHEVIVAAPSEAGEVLLAQASWLRVHPIEDTGKRDYLLSILDPAEEVFYMAHLPHKLKHRRACWLLFTSNYSVIFS